MGVLAWVAVIAVSGVVVVDTYLVRRMLLAYRRTGRRPHAWIALGITCSGLAGTAGAAIFASRDPAWVGSPPWLVARAVFLSLGAFSYGVMGPFVAAAFHPGSRHARALGAAAWLGLTAVGVLAATTEPAVVDSPATMRWGLRLPFVGLTTAVGLAGALSARALRRDLEAVRARGRVVDSVGLARMRLFETAAGALALSQLAVLGYPEHGDWASPLGFVGVAVIVGFSFTFAVCCFLVWATPAWLKSRWRST